MTVFGLTITRTKTIPNGLSGIETSGRRGWWPIVMESFSGAWQRNITITNETVLTFAAVYACVTRICMDIGKMRIRLVEQDTNGIWTEVDRNSPYWPVLRKPNGYQTRIQFYQTWMRSKLLWGNTLVLKVRDQRGIVVEMHVLDPMRVRTLVAPDGSVWYALSQDNLAQVEDAVTVPASEIIHDRTVDLYHPLAGISPISACGLAALQGLRVQEHSSNFFLNGAQPGGILSSPQTINDTQAAALQKQWEEGFSGNNYGRVAVLGGGFKYESMSVNATDSQLIEQLKLSAEMVCTAFGVPAYMVGVGPPPSYNNVEALSVQYYTQTLQNPIECIELLLDEGLGLDDAETRTGREYGTEFDLDDLMRMDKATLVTSLEGGKNIYTPNEQRAALNLPPVTGGDTVLRQQQDFSLEALAKRDAQPDPFAAEKPAAALPQPEPTDDESDDADETRDTDEWRRKSAGIELLYA